ncbi:PAS domain-containing sensor histidine kinase [Methanolobus bombayensis]|uniref:PAS domain-containing sensor histidine kinase n=1 Tax=Methanolobus bombayensis TaxID=38023 RepID=UPI001AE8CCE5|nr:PAS domain-containing sensor histidine kinase [Methanolobus bombayensis]MBP1908650.1 PAS domain S-box-containing protein [Methanolobus bombayensis]
MKASRPLDKDLEEENNNLRKRIEELELSLNSLKKGRKDELYRKNILFEGLLRSVPELVYWKDKNGKFLLCNTEFAKSFGMKIEEIVGKTDYDLHSRKEADSFRMNDKKIAREKEPVKNEEWVTFPDGIKKFFETYKAPLYTNEGEFIGIMGISRDITEQRTKEKELSKSHEQLLSVIEAFDDPAYVADPVTYELLFANRAIKKDMGDDIVGEKCYKVLQGFSAPCSFCTNQLIFGENIGKNHIWETQNIKNKRWYRCIDKAIEWPDGRMVRFEMAVDIHKEKTSQKALKESEEKYRTYINSSPHPTFVLDDDGNYIDVNPAACKVTGYSKKELLKMHLYDTFPQNEIPHRKSNFEEMKHTGRFSGEFAFMNKNGIQFYLAIEALKISDNRFLSICTDVTERKKAEDELLNAKIVAENANRTKNEFLANMSHELRTPLNSVIGFADVLMSQVSGEINDKQAKYINNISHSGKHLLNIINEILDISKIESGKMRLYKENISVIETFAEIIATLQHTASRKEIKLDVNPWPENECVYADKAKLKQVLYNLVGNAIKFTNEGGSVTIGTKNDGEFIHISVTDTGIGISSEGMKKLFKPFTQLESFESRSHEGTGLGLALSRELVELHGGNIRVESEPGKGSTFTFTLPVCK